MQYDALMRRLVIFWGEWKHNSRGHQRSDLAAGNTYNTWTIRSQVTAERSRGPSVGTQSARRLYLNYARPFDQTPVRAVIRGLGMGT